jgi:endonuclease/exonuclease/phosphatase family metal-dependent hydrolase
MTITVLSLNIWNDDGPWKERAERIREWIERLDPDLIGLQEVLVGPSRNQALELLQGRDYSVVYGKAIDFWKDATLGFGNAIASRWPISDSETVSLPDAGDGEKRIAISATIDAPVGPISFTSTHLNWKLHHGFVRERQVVALGELALRRRPRGGFPPLVVGDFNAEPESTEIRYTSGLHALHGKSLYLRDAWRHAGDAGPGTTWSNRNSYARSALEPERRIDYIFAAPPLANGVGFIETCRVVCDDERDGVWPSDHFGVFAELRSEPLPDSNAERSDEK